MAYEYKIDKHSVWKLLKDDMCALYVRDHPSEKESVDEFAIPLIQEFNKKVAEIGIQMAAEDYSQGIYPEHVEDGSYVKMVWDLVEPKVGGN